MTHSRNPAPGRTPPRARRLPPLHPGSGRGASGALAAAALLALGACGTTPAKTGPGAQAASRKAYPASSRSYEPPGPAADPWGPYVREASRRFDMPERWIRAVMRQESGGRVYATSPVGAMGLMQVMPGTYAELRARYQLGPDPYHPYDSLMAGTAYLREMYDLYGNPAFLAAYNAGPRRLEDYLWGGRGLPGETRNYVARIGPNLAGSNPGRRAPPEVYAAAEMPLNVPPGPRRADPATMLALREQRRQAQEPPVMVASLPAGPVTRMEPIPDGSTYAAVPPGAIASLGGAGPYAAAGRGGPVTAMAPIPDGSTYDAVPFPSAAAAPPVRVAAVGPLPLPAPAAGPVARVEPIADPVRMEPIPDGSTYAPSEPLPTPPARASQPDPEPARLPPRAATLPAPAGAPPRPPVFAGPAPAPRGQVFAALAAPAAAARTAPGARAPAGPATFVPATVPSAPRLSILGSANAAPAAGVLRLPTPPAPPAGPSAGAWAVQVGAFATEGLAREAADQARGGAGGGRAAVQPVPQGRGVLYRARVTGLSREGAGTACERLGRRGVCMVLSPDAQG